MITQEQHQEILRMYGEGVPMMKIAEKLGISSDTVYRHIKGHFSKGGYFQKNMKYDSIMAEQKAKEAYRARMNEEPTIDTYDELVPLRISKVEGRRGHVKFSLEDGMLSLQMEPIKVSEISTLMQSVNSIYNALKNMPGTGLGNG